VNFAAAMAVPWLVARFGDVRVLAAGLALGAIGLAWLGRLSGDTAYLTGIALPMILVGAGQGAVLGPLTAAGLAGVGGDDAGAASGITNVAHQLGGSLGLGILVAIFAAAHGDLADRRATALPGAAYLHALTLPTILASGARRSRIRVVLAPR
jgi:hypothetical protein